MIVLRKTLSKHKKSVPASVKHLNWVPAAVRKEQFTVDATMHIPAERGITFQHLHPQVTRLATSPFLKSILGSSEWNILDPPRKDLYRLEGRAQKYRMDHYDLDGM